MKPETSGGIGGIKANLTARLLAVIVLYRITPQESEAYKSLLSSARELAPSELDLHILLVDNSPEPAEFQAPQDHVTYEHSGQNRGLAGAYNRALALAFQLGYPWMLILDQDSTLPSEFLSALLKAINLYGADPRIAAFVPHILGDGRVLSPYWFRWGAFATYFSRQDSGISTHRTFALNSASTLRVSALRQIGGYSPWFWLDNSDAFTFLQLASFGKRIFILDGVTVEHELSMLHRTTRMSASRYRNVLMAESALWDFAMPWLAGLERTFRCFIRWILHMLRRDSSAFRKEAQKALSMRLFHSRRKRLDEWRSELLQRWPDLATAGHEAVLRRSNRISVCMASHNGERYIAVQLNSILAQLGTEDEIVVVDDASQDRTCEVICGLRDPRIRLMPRATNQGLVSSFEQAVCSSSGDIVFLSDQDDVWAPNKVAKIVLAFAEHPDVDLICTAIQTIDEQGLPVHDSTYSETRPFTASVFSNVLSNRFQGSTMAFRSRLIPRIVPFPSRYYVLHDVWIGLRHSLAGGKTLYVAEPLLYYRRHSTNVSRKLGRYLQIKKRLHLVFALASRALFDFFRRTGGPVAEL